MSIGTRLLLPAERALPSSPRLAEWTTTSRPKPIPALAVDVKL
jgi:hypothetical protein